jgi:hypothetical protein
MAAPTGTLWKCALTAARLNLLWQPPQESALKQAAILQVERERAEERKRIEKEKLAITTSRLFVNVLFSFQTLNQVFKWGPL